MGITMRQDLDRIAGAYEHQERQVRALQNALLDELRRQNSCKVVACTAYREHPAPWHAVKCGCACEARDLYMDHLRVLDAEANK